MSLFVIIIALALIGLLLWLINAYVPMTPGWKKTINIVAIVVVVVWLLRVFGAWEYMRTIRI